MIDVHRAMNTFDYDENDECMRDLDVIAFFSICSFAPLFLLRIHFGGHFISAVPGDDVDA